MAPYACGTFALRPVSRHGFAEFAACASFLLARLQTIHDHHADVYGLCSHPQRPFIIASSSRDTTLRLWSMEGETIVSHARLKVRARTLSRYRAPDPGIGALGL